MCWTSKYRKHPIAADAEWATAALSAHPEIIESTQHSAIELGPAHVSFMQAGIPEQRSGHQRELHICVGETGILEACRNKVRPAEMRAG
jgi:hypothetical protein